MLTFPWVQTDYDGTEILQAAPQPEKLDVECQTSESAQGIAELHSHSAELQAELQRAVEHIQCQADSDAQRRQQAAGAVAAAEQRAQHAATEAERRVAEVGMSAEDTIRAARCALHAYVIGLGLTCTAHNLETRYSMVMDGRSAKQCVGPCVHCMVCNTMSD